MRSLVYLVTILTLFSLSYSGEEPRPILGKYPNMTFKPVLLYRDAPERRTLGALTYLGGLQLFSTDLAFGGFSSMTITGDRFTLLSDGGNVVRFRMGPDLRPGSVGFGDLPTGPGAGWGKGSRDSESMTRDPDTGQIWVGFESANKIWRYSSNFTAGEASNSPPPMRDWDVNGGPESLVRLRDGNFIVIAETSERRGIPGRTALWFKGDPTNKKTPYYLFSFVPPEGGYDPSDMTELPDGRLLVLVRKISVTRWFESKLVLIDPAEIHPGAVIRGTEIAYFGPGVTRDNFEALAITRENDRTVLWIASDDNRELVQRSLLMKFRLDLPPRVQSTAPSHPHTAPTPRSS